MGWMGLQDSTELISANTKQNAQTHDTTTKKTRTELCSDGAGPAVVAAAGVGHREGRPGAGAVGSMAVGWAVKWIDRLIDLPSNNRPNVHTLIRYTHHPSIKPVPLPDY